MKCLLPILGLACSLVLPAASFGGESTNTALLFSFFRGNGEDGLHLARSTDGLQWTKLQPPAGEHAEGRPSGSAVNL
jgi:hypothetical protein